jgi:hypothetical protein
MPVGTLKKIVGEICNNCVKTSVGARIRYLIH